MHYTGLKGFLLQFASATHVHLVDQKLGIVKRWAQHIKQCCLSIMFKKEKANRILYFQKHRWKAWQLAIFLMHWSQFIFKEAVSVMVPKTFTDVFIHVTFCVYFLSWLILLHIFLFIAVLWKFLIQSVGKQDTEASFSRFGFYVIAKLSPKAIRCVDHGRIQCREPMVKD